jgi:hypothetical protein
MSRKRSESAGSSEGEEGDDDDQYGVERQSFFASIGMQRWANLFDPFLLPERGQCEAKDGSCDTSGGDGKLKGGSGGGGGGSESKDGTGAGAGAGSGSGSGKGDRICLAWLYDATPKNFQQLGISDLADIDVIQKAIHKELARLKFDFDDEDEEGISDKKKLSTKSLSMGHSRSGKGSSTKGSSTKISPHKVSPNKVSAVEGLTDRGMVHTQAQTDKDESMDRDVPTEMDDGIHIGLSATDLLMRNTTR